MLVTGRFYATETPHLLGSTCSYRAFRARYLYIPTGHHLGPCLYLNTTWHLIEKMEWAATACYMSSCLLDGPALDNMFDTSGYMPWDRESNKDFNGSIGALSLTGHVSPNIEVHARGWVGKGKGFRRSFQIWKT